MPAWSEVRRFDSSDNNVTKYVFTKEGAIAESVLYRYPIYRERTVVCCSTQSGCPVGCSFCGTGKMFTRNLLASEILAQVEHCFEDRKINPRTVEKLQIMFMSMGEPMLNLANVDNAIRMMSARWPNASLLISTMAPTVTPGAWKKLIQLSRDIHKVGLQFSVHESTDDARGKLIPLKDKLTLSEMAEMGAKWAHATGRRPFFNYCARTGNTSDADADRLADLFNPREWECTVSVVCERKESVKAATERQQELAGGFASKMLARGYSVRVFNPAGQDDIGGGCGQLWFVQKWMKERKAG